MECGLQELFLLLGNVPLEIKVCKIDNICMKGGAVSFLLGNVHLEIKVLNIDTICMEGSQHPTSMAVKKKLSIAAKEKNSMLATTHEMFQTII